MGSIVIKGVDVVVGRVTVVMGWGYERLCVGGCVVKVVVECGILWTIL